MNKRNYHITFSGNVKSTNPLTRLLAGIIALAAIPFIFIAFTGLFAFMLIAFVFIAAAGAMFLKFLGPNIKDQNIKDPNIIEGVKYTVVDEAAGAPSSQHKSGEIINTTRRKPVVIEHDPDNSN